MQFKVVDWMMDLVVYVSPDATVSEALALMRRRYIHSLIVNRTAESDYGILTSTDISDKIVAQEQNPDEVKVRDIMTSPLTTVQKEMLLKDCAKLMKQHRIHHLPVVDANGAIVGMISASDFLVAAEAMARKPGERIS